MKKIMFWLLLLVALATPAQGEIQEDLPFKYAYDLSGVRIVTVAADQFSFEETVELSGLWRDMGAQVLFAGPKKSLAGEKLAAPGQARGEAVRLDVDLLLDEIDARRCDLIYIAGGDGIGRFVQEHGAALRALLAGAHQGKACVAAICHASMALSLSPRIRGSRVTGNGDEELEALIQAGAVVVDEVFVRDGAFLTGQYPFLRTFALQVAETLQFPQGNGPLQAFLAGRTPLQKAMADLRSSQEISGQPVPREQVEAVLRSAYQTILLRPWGNYPPLFTLVSVRDEKAREAIARVVEEQLKEKYLAQFGSEERIQEHVRKCFQVPPELFFVFLDTRAAGPEGSPFREIAFRAAVSRYGAALENIALTARSLGLGVGLLGFPPFLQAAEKAARDVLGIPESMAFLDLFVLGYPLRNNPPAIDRPLEALLRTGTMKQAGDAK